jgi:Sperm-tail PG-rich repeat
MGAKY